MINSRVGKLAAWIIKIQQIADKTRLANRMGIRAAHRYADDTGTGMLKFFDQYTGCFGLVVTSMDEEQDTFDKARQRKCFFEKEGWSLNDNLIKILFN